MRIEVPKVYERCFVDMDEERCCKHLWYSPRCSGKSATLGRLIYLYYMRFSRYDIAVGVDSLSNAGNGVISEFASFLYNEGLSDGWVIGKHVVYLRGRSNQIRSYPVQTNELQNVNVTKSKKTVRPVSLFIMDEVQKLHNEDILVNCLSTFLRQLKSGHSKVILAGNPDRGAMWFDAFYKKRLNDPHYADWTVLKPTYFDVLAWLPDAQVAEITAMKEVDPVRYAQIYMGDLEVAGWEQVFHSFSTASHYILRDTLIERDSRRQHATRIQSIVIGIDDARAVDALVATCITNHQDGRLRVQETLYLSCKELSVKPALTERISLIAQYLDYIQLHFNQERILPIYIVIDGASELTTQMRVFAKTDKEYMRWRNVKIFEYTQKQDKEKQLDTVNAAFATGTLVVVNVDEYSPQYSNNVMVEQIKALRYTDSRKVDPNIPNDCTDALQYGVMTILANPYNLSLPRRKERYDMDNSSSNLVNKLNDGYRTPPNANLLNG